MKYYLNKWNLTLLVAKGAGGDYLEISERQYAEIAGGGRAGKALRYSEEKGIFWEDLPEDLEALAVQVRGKRALLLEAPLLRLSIFEQQERYGIPTTITPADATALAMYIQELRDITLQRGFPAKVYWPAMPETKAEEDARLDREYEEAQAERVREAKAKKVAEAQAALDALKQE